MAVKLTANVAGCRRYISKPAPTGLSYQGLHLTVRPFLFYFLNLFVMNSTEFDLPVAVALAAAPLVLTGKTVGQVVDAIGRHLRRAELEPEWILAANWVGDANDSMVGLKDTAPWPTATGNDNQRRIRLSVETGHSEGWRVQVDHVCLHKAGDSGHWSSVPLIRIKTLTRSQAWAVAAAVSRLLDID